MLNLHQSAEKAANQLTQSSTAEVIPFTARVTIKEVEVYSSIRAALPESESLVPNRANIAKHLYTLFAPAFVQPYPEAWIEIAYSDPVTGSVNAAETFSVFQLREAAEFAEKKNRAGSNIYVGPALRQGDRPPGGRAKDEHALTSSYAWAEYDGAGDDERIAAILDEQSFKPALVVTTGTVPHVRRHLYFELDGSVTPEQLKAINTSLMELLGSDAVHNISRIMRLAGTIIYPSPKKQGRGYIAELVTLHVNPEAPVYRADDLIGLTGEPSGSKSNNSDSNNKGKVETFRDLPADLQKLIASPPFHNEDRSKTAGCVAWKMFARGWSNDAVRALFEEYSNGIGQRYPKDKNLREEIERLRQKFNEKPTSLLPNDIITEDSAAVEFVEKHGEHLRFCHSTGSWYTWNGVYWAKDQTTIVFQWARELVRQLAQDQDERKRYITNKTSFASGVERFAKGDPKIAVTVNYWDSDQWLLGTPGGTVDLRTGLLCDSQRHDGITKITSVAPLDSGCPQWLQFLKETTGDDRELIRFLQQWCGYGRTGSIREHALVFVYGPGGNGKGVFVNVVTKILGDYVATAAMDTFTASHSDKHPTYLAKLRGARLVTASETEEGRAWAESRIKQMTGGDRISARFMRQDFFEYDPQFKLTIIGNHKPVLRNVDDAAKRRFLIVPFENKPKVPDLKLEEKLLAEAPAILQWMISGCLDWRVNGLVKPPIVVTATNEYFADQDLFAQWPDEACECDPGNNYKSATGTELFQSWRGYATSASEEPGSQKSFAGRMARHGFIAKRTMKARTFLGIRLIPKASYHEHDA